MLKLKFEWLPASWGLKGKAFERAKAEYELSGYDLDVRLAEIEYTGTQLFLALSEINYRHGRITEQQYEFDKASQIEDEYERGSYLHRLHLKYGMKTDIEYRRAKLELDHKFQKISDDELKLGEVELEYKEGKISQLEYEKRTATIKGEPWVSVINMDFKEGPNNGGTFELDWNRIFVDKLIEEGYDGASEDAVVDIWFMNLCRTIALNHFDGVGTFNEDSELALEEVMKKAKG